MYCNVETLPRQKFSVRVLNKIAFRLELVARWLRKLALTRFHDFQFNDLPVESGSRDVTRLKEWTAKSGEFPTVEEIDKQLTKQ